MAISCVAVACSAVGTADLGASEDPLGRFWRENDGKVVRRLPIDVLPENVFLWFTNRDFADGMKVFDRLADECFAQSTYNCVTFTLRCNPDLSDVQTLEATRKFFAKAHASGLKVYMDTDPRRARREFLARWPDERQGVVSVVVAAPTNGVASFAYEFKDAEDHMTSGGTASYRPLSARVAAAFAARRGADGSPDLSSRRTVEIKERASMRHWQVPDNEGCGQMDHAAATVTATAGGLAGDEVLVAVVEADYDTADVFSPHLIPFERELMARYKDLGADGGMRDEWGFIPDYRPDLRTYWWSPNLAAAYRAATGRDLMDDFPLMAVGPSGDAARSAAIRAYMRLLLDRCAEIEEDFYATDKRLFGEDVYVVKHPTWHDIPCPQEYWHNGLDWWRVRRDWAQGDEMTPIYALNAMAKKWGGPSWLNEGYTGTPEQNAFRVWTYAICGGRQVFHCLYSGNPKEMEKYARMPWEARRARLTLDLLAPGNVAAQSRVRLLNLISRAQADCPVAFVFGHERLMDWSCDGWDDHGRRQLQALHAGGWWCDAYPASECASSTFSVDEDGWLRVGQQRYLAVMLHNLSDGERRAFDALVDGRPLKTRVFGGGEEEAVAAFLQERGAVRQPAVKAKTKAGRDYPEPDGTLHLIDGTTARIWADWEHLSGLPIDCEIESNGVKASVAAEGVAAIRAEGGEIVALAAGGLKRVDGPGLAIELGRPENVALLKIDGEWHGVWQTSTPCAPLPAELAALTPHWIRLVVPPEEETGWVDGESAVLPPYNEKAGGWYAGYRPQAICMWEIAARQALLPETVRVVAADGRELRSGEDFKVHPNCGDVGLVGEVASDPAVNPVSLSYGVRLERLDAWYREPDGSVEYLRGAAVPSRPALPILPKDAKLVATRWVRG
ncbi:MAG: hypothetical protein IKO40_01990, partial [Kiritimatiellae bacterium]|nr:hypothetical protein [Kiritimatiellia bacterium]